LKEKITLYHNPRCRKSREALAYLEEKNISPEIILYFKEPFTEKTLKALLSKLELAPKALVRTEETLWKTTYKNETLDDGALLKILVTHPNLIQRPIVATAQKAVLARPLENLISFLQNH